MANSKLLILDEAIAHQKKHHKLVKHPFFLSKPRIHLGMINLLLHSVKLQKTTDISLASPSKPWYYVINGDNLPIDMTFYSSLQKQQNWKNSIKIELKRICRRNLIKNQTYLE
ncbi:hypothetical protein [Trichodesmium erythraeum]|uniref:hypothetical protein n=1 Tax=Trichodesmium erythraeum TaxID=1206 RepID=UPI00005765CA